MPSSVLENVFPKGGRMLGLVTAKGPRMRADGVRSGVRWVGWCQVVADCSGSLSVMVVGSQVHVCSPALRLLALFPK